jgi:hypothetical protein
VVFQSLRADRALRAQAWPIVGSDPAAPLRPASQPPQLISS